MKLTERVRERAISALDGMRSIVRAEMLTQGEYIESEISNPRRLASLCGGRKHCAVGSLWVGGGIRPHVTPGGAVHLPGTSSWEREAFLRRRPALRVAYNALNEAARDFADSHDIALHGFDNGIEGLFENFYGEELTKRDLLAVIAAAKRKVRAA